MPLSEDEQRILNEIEQQFYVDDPDLADEISETSLYAYCLRQMKWAALLFVAATAVLVTVLITATPFAVAFGAFVVMLGAVLWFEHSLRKMGRAGKDQLSARLRSSGMRQYLTNAGERFRDRTQRDRDEPPAPDDPPAT